jgi:glycerate kinase
MMAVMRVLIAPDSFGGTLSAVEAATAIADGWRRTDPAADLVARPLSDGGPGFIDVLVSGLPRARRLPVEVRDPLGRPTPGEVLLDGATGYVESAQAAGLHLVTPDERDPNVTTSFGVGTLIAAAVEAGAGEIVVGLGGSATNDGGAGMLAGLGVVARDGTGGPLPYGGAALSAVAAVDGVPLLRGARLVAATDVDNPLLGLYGATAVYGPQKGADQAAIMSLDVALERWAVEVERAVGLSGLRDRPGAGAAGGLGFGLMALGAERCSGADLVMEAVGLEAAIDGAGLVVTGEGRFDATSMRGKVVSGVARRAQEAGVPCVVAAGQAQVGARDAAAHGIDEVWSVAEELGSADAALSAGADGVRRLGGVVARSWSR